MSHQKPILGAAELNTAMQLAPSMLVLFIAFFRSNFDFSCSETWMHVQRDSLSKSVHSGSLHLFQGEDPKGTARTQKHHSEKEFVLNALEREAHPPHPPGWPKQKGPHFADS